MQPMAQLVDVMRSQVDGDAPAAVCASVGDGRVGRAVRARAGCAVPRDGGRGWLPACACV